jgi:zona occludens toxin (predicted ATPase)
MPRVNLPHTQITRVGVAPGAEVNGDATNDHVTVNDGRVYLLVRNADGSNAHAVTIVTPGTVDGQAIADRIVSVPANASRYIGPFPVDTYGRSLQVDVDSSELKLTAYHL